jgi:signal transduction histidine kinase
MSAPPDMPDSNVPENAGPHPDRIRNLHIKIPAEQAAAIAHELNQPLAAILGNAQAARRFITAGDLSRDELLAILDDIIHDTKRAAGIVNSLRQPSP